MGWDGTDGWITRPPANSHNPNFTCAVEKISLVCPPSLASSLQGKERRKPWEGRGEGAAAAAPSSVGSATSSFCRHISCFLQGPVSKKASKQSRIVAGPLLLVLCYILRHPCTCDNREWSGSPGREEASWVEKPPSKFLDNLDLLRGSIPHCARSCILEIPASGGLVWWERKLREGGREEVSSVDGGRTRIQIVG